jgi:hypothetical protein
VTFARATMLGESKMKGLLLTFVCDTRQCWLYATATRQLVARARREGGCYCFCLVLACWLAGFGSRRIDGFNSSRARSIVHASLGN